MKKLSILCAALILSACNSGGVSYTYPDAVGTTPPAPPVSMVDAFYSTVLQYLSPTSEDTDATPIDSVVATEPEDTEPVEFS